MRDQEELLIGLTPSGTGLAPQLPPSCPMPECTAQTFLALLYAIQPNHRGDLLFECLACGYEAVYRVRSRQFKPRPGRPQEGWRPPLVSVVLTAGHPEATPVERMATERAPSPLAQSQLGGGQEDGPTKQASMEKKDVTMGTASTNTSSTSETVDERCAGANSITIRERSRNMTTERINTESVNLQGPPTELSGGQQQRKRSGPKTREGKAKVRQNPVRHGLTARLPVIPGLERIEEWEAYRAEIVKSLSPEEGIQRVLAERIAQVSWRLNRAPRFEAWAISYATLEEGGRAALAMATRPAFTFPLSSEKDQNERRSGEGNPGLSPFCLPDSSGLDRLSRYEAHLARQRVQDLHELEALQARRRGERAPLARLDVTGLPESA